MLEMNTNLIIISVGTAVAIGETKSYRTNKSLAMKPVVGGFVAGIFLFALDAVSPTIAKAFAVLVIVGALVVNWNSIVPASFQLGAK